MHWTLDDIRWDAFDASKVDPDLLAAVKAAAMVEFAADDYVTYLRNVFADRDDVQAVIAEWGDEEVQHGKALARWAELADPEFNFSKRFKVFQDGYRIPMDEEASVRGSRGGELVARCVVESGTSSFYSAIKDATDEPVLKQIAGNIAADEFRHYRLFYELLQTFSDEIPSRFAKARIAVERVNEADDDELAYAYYAANFGPGSGVAYDRTRCSRAYAHRAARLYRRRHLDRLVSMVAKAAGLRPQGVLVRLVQSIAWTLWTVRARFLERAAA